MFNKKSVLLFIATICVVLFACASPTQATFTDFLYKFQGRWSDIAVSSTGRVFIINESYSRIEEYNTSGVLQTIHGSFGTGATQFNRPQGLTIDASDVLYILDTGNNRVARYNVSAASPSFVAVDTWGSYGSDVGQFNNPSGITADATSVYIADTDNNRIQKCTFAGSCDPAWGSIGMSDGKFSSPKGIAYDVANTRIYVADTGNNRIQWFNTAGTFVGKLGTYGSGSTQFILPYRIVAKTSGDYIYVLDTLNRIQRVSVSSSLTDATISLPTSGGGMKIVSSTLYVTALPTTFLTYNATTMSNTPTLSTTNDIGRPVDMALDSSGNFFINNNFDTPVIQKFNSSFIQTGEWTGGVGGFAKTANGPMGIGINTGNDVIVADTDNNKIQKYTNATSTWTNITPAPTGFISPIDVAFEATGKYYVTDMGNGRIVKFNTDGSIIWTQLLPTVGMLTPTPFGGTPPAPYGITLDSNNDIYVADIGYHRILRYNANLLPTPEPTMTWGEYGTADLSVIPQLDKPQGMAIDAAGNIYVTDTGNNRMQRFDQTGGGQVKWGRYGTQDGYFDQPRNVAVDASSNVFVSEVGNRRIQAFGDATESAGITIVQTNGTTVSEGLTDATTGIDSYTIRLNTQPSTPVYIQLTVDHTDQAYVVTSNTSTPTLLTFTHDNWNIPQTVSVVPIHDFVANGTHTVVVSHAPYVPSGSTVDVHYQTIAAGHTWPTVNVSITDAVDVQGITFSSNTVAWATEGAHLANAYSIVLNTKPLSDVTVTLTPPTAITLDDTSFVFTPDNYSTPRLVGFTPVHDYEAQATHSANIAHSAASSDPAYNSPDVTFSEASGNVLVTIQDIDTSGVTLSKSSVSVTENGTTDSYTIKLNSKPTSSVTIYPTDASPSPSELVTLSPSELTFTDTTWSTPQTVTVTAIHDYLKNAVSPRTTNIIHPATLSSDPVYSNITIATVSASITDSDTGSLLIFKVGGGSVLVAEGGATDTYSFQLTSIPTSDVNVTITSTDNQATTSAYFYTFTPANWNTPQLATVSAVNDIIEEGTHNGILIHTLSSSDPNFDAKIAYQTAVITDNDAAGITITLPNTTINIAEAGPTDYYYVKLNSQPTSPVTLVFSAQNQATASPTHLIFTPSNWMDNQTVTLTAIQDYIVEGSTTATVTYTGDSADTNYQGKTASFVANVYDDDSMSPGVSVNETNGGTSVTKDTTTDTYTLVLTSKPSANVKIKIVANGPEATTSAGVYWFLPTTWNVPQTVNVSAVTSPTGGKSVVFTHYATSLDLHYNGIYVPTVTVAVNEKSTSSSSSSGPVKAPVCSKTPPYSAPNLFQINTTQNQATLYFTPIHDNITYYFIAYGFEPGDFRFGTSFEMGPYDGVINYTVNMLTPGTKYYFTVRGGNGCATGPWSAAVPATAVGSEYSTTTGWTFYAPVSTATTTGSTGSTSGTSGSTGSSSPTGGIWLTRDLYPGSQGADVRSLQEHLNAHGFTLASSGPGSPGNETTFYGNLTASAVRRFQEAHFAEILSPLGYASGTGICGSSTRNYINSHP